MEQHLEPDSGKEKRELKQAAGPGQLCPECKQGILDYDGLLNLACPNCNYQQAGCFT